MLPALVSLAKPGAKQAVTPRIVLCYFYRLPRFVSRVLRASEPLYLFILSCFISLVGFFIAFLREIGVSSSHLTVSPELSNFWPLVRHGWVLEA